MLFNSTIFLQFFAAFLLGYWLARNDLRARNLLILAGSYLFYGWWDWRFLSLIFISTLLDYSVGLALERATAARSRKTWLALSLAGNLGILGFFKYYDFFVESLTASLAQWGIPFHPGTLNLVLPVGISFYTFQTMSYAIDVYRHELKPTRSFINFAAYVAFFPQLVAGPIERGQRLLPQFERPLKITREGLEEGLWLMLWGLFKKVVIADNLAPLVEMVFHGGPFSAPTVLLATLAFGFQIYCDFSGYSDIARGSARWLGFDIMVNFNLPYVAKNLREFWRRWHISLSTWLRDYLYISLGGNRRGPLRTSFNLMATMLLGGLWHGAAWNFVGWGLWHGVGLMVCRLWQIRFASTQSKSRAAQFTSWLVTMLFVFYGWLLFRAGSVQQIGDMSRALGTWTIPSWLGSYGINLVVFTIPLILMEGWQHLAQNRLIALTPRYAWKIVLQGILLLAIVLFWEQEKIPFIYFQF